MVNHPEPARDIIGIGASAGGVEALTRLFSLLPANLPATILVVLHRAPTTVTNLSRVLGRRSPLPAADGREDETIVPGRIYIAPAGRHMVVSHAGSIKLLDSPKQQFCRPAIDPLFASLADRYRQRVVGTILTGSGRDGVEGLRSITAAGGYSIAQQPAEAQHESMPLHAIQLDHVNFVGTVDAIAERLRELASGRDS